MTSPFAPACPPATVVGPSAAIPTRRRGAKTLFALALLTPLAACAAQPVTPGAGEGAAVASSQPAPQSQARTQDQTQGQTQERSAAGTNRPNAAAPTRPAPAGAGGTAPQTSTPANSAANSAATAPPATRTTPGTGMTAPSQAATGSASGTPAGIPASERATTVGEVPTTAGTPNPAPDAASMPGAPAAIPGTPANPAPMPQAASGPSAGSLLQTILALGLVLALLAALAWAMKRYGPKMSGSSANLRMVGALNIGGRERIMVVEVGDQWIVVGASPGRVNALATMPKGEGAQAAQETATLAGHAPPAATFADWLKQTIDKRNVK